MPPQEAGERSLAWVGLGSNVEPESNLPAAVEELARSASVLAVSSAYETPPVGPPGQPTFLNAAVLLATALDPAVLKAKVLRPIEARLRRQRGPDPYAPRTIDLDLLMYWVGTNDLGESVYCDPEILDHLHLALPLAELSPEARHPTTGETLTAICRRLLDASPAAGQQFRRRDDLDLLGR